MLLHMGFVIRFACLDFESLLLFIQHVDIAALLIKFNTCVNAVDKWGFTPLHEAAQKGRTQLCALLVSL
jgi:ankyrin repeat protein